MRSTTCDENMKMRTHFSPCPCRRKPLVAKKYRPHTGISRDSVPIVLERKKLRLPADFDDLEGAKDISARSLAMWVVFQLEESPTRICIFDADRTSNATDARRAADQLVDARRQ